MSFKPCILFAVGHEGATPRLLIVQGPQAIVNDGAGVTGFTLTTGAMFDGAGNALSGNVAGAFTVTFTGAAGPVFTGTVAFNWAGFRLMPLLRQQRLIKAFSTGGRVVLQIETGQPLPEALPITLRALKTADYSMSATGDAEPAYPAGQAAPNLTIPAGDTGVYTYSCAALGGALVASVSGVLTPPGPVALPPGSNNLQLTVHTELDAPNGLGLPDHISANSVLPIDVHVPADVVVMVDRSGSMNRVNPATGQPKWTAARDVANLFAQLYGGALPNLASPAGNIVANNRISLGHFTYAAAAQISVPPLAPANPAPSYNPALAPSGGTPIGQALKQAGDALPASTSRQRHVLLLTDGMDNSGTPSLVTLAADPALLPKASADPAKGVTLHNISYALPGETHAYSLSALATAYGGRYHDGAVDANPLDSEGLLQMFLSILSDILPVEHAAVPASLPTTTVENGVERAIFVATEQMAPGSVLQANGGGQLSSDALAGSAHGYSWAVVDQPRPGPWTITNAPAGASLFVLYDLALRMRCGVHQDGLGRPIKVWAEVKQRDLAVENADIRVGVKRPGESMGDVVTKFVRAGGLVSGVRRSLFRSEHVGPEILLAADTEALSPTASAFNVQRSPEVSLQRVVLEAAERARNLPLQIAGDALELKHVGGGRYEAELDAARTQNEGVYTFNFHGNGVTPEGFAFTRDYRVSTVLAPLPDPKQSSIAVKQLAANLVQVTVFPKSSTGLPLGPGLGYALGFQYAGADERKRLKAPQLIDNLDGSYSARIELEQGQRLPPVGLYFGSPAEGHAIVVTEPHKNVRKVRVTLDKIQVLDDKDPCMEGKGEIAFDAVIAPNASPARAVRARIPAKGTLGIESGETVELGQLIYDDVLEEGASLSLTIGGKEFDWLRFAQRSEPLARYHRQLELTPGKHELTPDDEKVDPESLSDWRLWYTVEVS